MYETKAYFSFSKLLSQQQHYDWGLRAIRTVLNACSRIIKQFRRTVQSADELSLKTELELVVKALRTDTLPKLTYSDSVKFDDLIHDVFVDVNFEIIGNADLNKIMEEVCGELGYQINNRQVLKLLKATISTNCW